MSGAVRVDLGALDPGLRLDGHLPECPNRSEPDTGCDWCLWALDGAGVRRTLDVVHDVEALVRDHDRRRGEVSVAWVVAAGDLLDADPGDPVGPDSPVPSVREISARLDRVRASRCRPLRSLLDRAVAADGPVERRCLSTAGPLAAAALQRPEHESLRSQLPSRVRDRLDRAASLLSADTQSAGLLPSVESRHWDGLPTLRTQIAWARRRRSTRTREDRDPRSRPARGSLEALVVESVLDSLLDELGDIGGELATAAPPVVLPRAATGARLSERTRAMTWRIARIDWHLTFVHTGRAEAWPASIGADRDGSRVSGDLVPWTVALAIAEGDRAGLVSATHRG